MLTSLLPSALTKRPAHLRLLGCIKLTIRWIGIYSCSLNNCNIQCFSLIYGLIFNWSTVTSDEGLRRRWPKASQQMTNRLIIIRENIINNQHWKSLKSYMTCQECLIGLGDSVSDYYPWGRRFYPRHFHNFKCGLGLERDPPSLVRTIGYLLDWEVFIQYLFCCVTGEVATGR